MVKGSFNFWTFPLLDNLNMYRFHTVCFLSTPTDLFWQLSYCCMNSSVCQSFKHVIVKCPCYLINIKVIKLIQLKHIWQMLDVLKKNPCFVALMSFTLDLTLMVNMRTKRTKLLNIFIIYIYIKHCI